MGCGDWCELRGLIQELHPQMGPELERTLRQSCLESARGELAIGGSVGEAEVSDGNGNYRDYLASAHGLEAVIREQGFGRRIELDVVGTHALEQRCSGRATDVDSVRHAIGWPVYPLQHRTASITRIPRKAY